MEPEGDGGIIDRPTDDNPIENLEIDDAKLPLHEFALLNKELDAMEDLMEDERGDQFEGYVSVQEFTRLQQESVDLTVRLVQSDWSPTTHVDMRISAEVRLVAHDLPVRSSLSARAATREKQL